MKVRYNQDIDFYLPNELNESERVDFIYGLLEDNEELFQYTEDQDTPYDGNIRRVLDQFSYYLCTAKKQNEDGTQLRNDKNIMRTRKIRNRRNTELELYDRLSFGSTLEE